MPGNMPYLYLISGHGPQLQHGDVKGHNYIMKQNKSDYTGGPTRFNELRKGMLIFKSINQSIVPCSPIRL